MQVGRGVWLTAAIACAVACSTGESADGPRADAGIDSTDGAGDVRSEDALPPVPIGAGPDISPYLVGQNLWWPASVDQLWPLVKKSGVRLVRIGGIAADKTPPSSVQILAWVDAIRAIGAEPLVQISRNSTPIEAADVVRFLNVTNQRSVKLWSIGNEPDLDGLTAAQVGPYVRASAPAMRDVDATIQIYAPDSAWYDPPMMTSLLGGAEDITGTDAKGRDYIDGVSWHRYPFGSAYDRVRVLGEAIDGTRASIEDLLVRMEAADTKHGRTGARALTWAMGELNITYDNPTSNTVDGVGVQSFLNGQFFAQIYALGMRHRAVFVASWSVYESGGDRGPTDLGYLDGPLSNPEPRSTYWHMQLIAEELSGRFAAGTSNTPAVRAFGAGDGTKLSVMLLNVDASASFSFTLRLDTGVVGGTGTVKIGIDAGTPIEHSGSIEAQSTAVIVFGAGGKPLRRIDYSLTSAMNAAPPTVTTF